MLHATPTFLHRKIGMSSLHAQLLQRLIEQTSGKTKTRGGRSPGRGEGGREGGGGGKGGNFTISCRLYSTDDRGSSMCVLGTVQSGTPGQKSVHQSQGSVILTTHSNSNRIYTLESIVIETIDSSVTQMLKICCPMVYL